VAKLSAAQRKKIPTSSFAVPSKAKTASGKATSGSYPINDAAHARNALARSSGKPEAAQVRAAVKRKYPNMGASTKKRK
jgi:hypothetical protein